MLVRVVEREDGGVTIITPCRPLREGETWPEYYAETFGKALANSPELIGRPFADIDHESLPADRKDRERWRLRGKRVIVSAEKEGTE